MRSSILRAFLLAFVTLNLSVVAAGAADCGDSADGFRAWLEDFKQVAINDGVSPDVVDSALATATFDRSVLAHDHGQAALQGNYAAFAARHITPGRMKRAKMMLLAYAEPLQRIEQRFGVPGPVLVAIWGLETDFGSGLGQYPTFSALANSGVRLPSRQPLSGRAHRRAHDRAARPPGPVADERGLGRGAWPDAVHAVRLLEIRGFGEWRARG